MYVYSGNIVYGARSLLDLLDQLRVLFNIFLYYNIYIYPIKLYLNYLDMRLYGKRVNSLGLTTSDEKLKLIYLLTYPHKLGAIEYYFGLTIYLQSYIHFYI